MGRLDKLLKAFFDLEADKYWYVKRFGTLPFRCRYKDLVVDRAKRVRSRWDLVRVPLIARLKKLTDAAYELHLSAIESRAMIMRLNRILSYLERFGAPKMRFALKYRRSEEGSSPDHVYITVSLGEVKTFRTNEVTVYFDVEEKRFLVVLDKRSEFLYYEHHPGLRRLRRAAETLVELCDRARELCNRCHGLGLKEVERLRELERSASEIAYTILMNPFGVWADTFDEVAKAKKLVRAMRKHVKKASELVWRSSY